MEILSTSSPKGTDNGLEVIAAVCLQGHCNQFPRLPLGNVVVMEERGGSRSWANQSMIEKKKNFQKQQNWENREVVGKRKVINSFSQYWSA